MTSDNEDLYSVDFPGLSGRSGGTNSMSVTGSESDGGVDIRALLGYSGQETGHGQMGQTAEDEEEAMYPTMVWRGDSFQPIYRPLSPNIRKSEEWEAIDRQRAKTVTSELTTFTSQEEADLTESLRYRRYNFERMQQRLRLGRPYLFPRPWSPNYRNICAKYPTLLRKYIDLEQETAGVIKKRLKWISEHGTTDSQMSEGTILQYLQNARTGDPDSDDSNMSNYMMTKIIDEMERMLCHDIENLGQVQHGGVSRGTHYEALTEVSIEQRAIIRKDTALNTKYEDLVDMERSTFPERFENRLHGGQKARDASPEFTWRTPGPDYRSPVPSPAMSIDLNDGSDDESDSTLPEGCEGVVERGEWDWGIEVGSGDTAERGEDPVWWSDNWKW